MDPVDNFLTNTIKFPGWRTVLQKDREEFLYQFVKKHVCNVYFHNLGLAIQDNDFRTVPNAEGILENGFSGRGGLCNQLNLFAKHILDEIGFGTIAIAGTWAMSPVPGTHCMLIVCLDVQKKYLIDIASGSPNWHPIPLHQLPIRRTAGGYDYEFRLGEDGETYQRVQFGGSLIKGDFKENDEELRYSFQCKDVTLKDIEPAMTYIYTSPKCYLQTLPFMFRHIENGDSCDEFILVWGKTVVKGKRDSREILKFETYDELLDCAINNYFPNLDKGFLENVFDKFKRHECIPYRF